MGMRPQGNEQEARRNKHVRSAPAKIAVKALGEDVLDGILDKSPNPLLLILDCVQDPHNLGAIHEILFQVLAAFYRQGHFAVGIHDVHFRNRRKTVVGSSLEVCLRIGTSATIGRIALHDCAVHFPYKWCNECRLEKIMSARFAGGEFYRNLSFGFTTESLVDLHKIFRGNFLDKIEIQQNKVSHLQRSDSWSKKAN